MNRLIVTVLAVSLALVVAAQGTREDYQRAQNLRAFVQERTYKTSLNPEWFAGGSRFWYSLAEQEGRRYYRVVTATGEKDFLFDNDRLSEVLAEAAERRVSARNLPISNIRILDELGDRLEFTAFDQVWRLSLPDYEIVKHDPPAGPRGPGGRGRTGLSPDGKWEALVRQGRLILREVESGEEHRVGPDRPEGHEWATSFQWSPTSRHLVATLVEPGDRLRMTRMRSLPEQGFRPEALTHVYALPGDKLDLESLYVIDTATKAHIRADSSPLDFPWNRMWRWAEDGTTLSYLHVHRGYNPIRYLELEVATGNVRTLVEERFETFVDPTKLRIHHLENGDFLWVSERTDWNHLYRIERSTARTIPLTQGEFVVRDILRVDEEEGWVIFSANGRESGENPYHLHAYRVSLTGGPLTRLTELPAHHRISLSPDGKALVVTASRPDMPPVFQLRSTATGNLIAELDRADIDALTATGFRLPEPFHAPDRDGTHEVWGVIYRPSNFDPDKKYRVVEYIYQGPHGQHVPLEFGPFRREQMIAEIGFIVVMVDGRGTSYRSKSFQDHAYRNLGDAGLPDHMAWLRAAAAKYPEMDLEGGIGIYGYSAGGYDSTRALLMHPDFYVAAVSLCGNHDHRTDKVWWNELWMGYPVGPWYEEQSNVTQAHRLQGDLLLIHGELDDNVNAFASTVRLVDALIRAEKRFQWFYVPGRDHNLGGWYLDRMIMDHFVRSLYRREPEAR